MICTIPLVFVKPCVATVRIYFADPIWSCFPDLDVAAALLGYSSHETFCDVAYVLICCVLIFVYPTFELVSLFIVA